MKINESRFRQYWSNVVEELEPRTKGNTPCWLWIGTYVYIPQLYGRLSTVGVAVCAATIACRAIPSKVTHRCKTHLCVNPMHLMFRTLAEKKPSFSRVTGHKLSAKLTDDQSFIREVLHERKVDHRPNATRIVYRKYSTVAELSAKFNVSESTIKKVLLKSPIYDLLDEIKELEIAGLDIQLAPHKKQGNLSLLDNIHYNRNYSLPEYKNEKTKI